MPRTPCKIHVRTAKRPVRSAYPRELAVRGGDKHLGAWASPGGPDQTQSCHRAYGPRSARGGGADTTRGRLALRPADSRAGPGIPNEPRRAVALFAHEFSLG